MLSDRRCTLEYKSRFYTSIFLSRYREIAFRKMVASTKDANCEYYQYDLELKTTNASMQ